MTPTRSNLLFKGRPGDVRLGELAQCTAVLSDFAADQPKRCLVIYGCPDDLGVTANRGRAGAASGPDGIRAAWYKMTPPLAWDEQTVLIDLGNIPVSNHITENHQAAYKVAKEIAERSFTTVALGGGHDYAAPNILGWAEGRLQRFKAAKPKRTKPALGLINVDPHLDVRELENGQPHSGTPFRQVLESGLILGKYFVEFGARDGRNAKSHFAYCQNQNVRVRLFDDIRTGSAVTKFKSELAFLEKNTDAVALTIDMDSCCELEGVSAAPVIGFSAWELCQFAFIAGLSKKISFLELAETAPSLDPTGRSARVAAEVLFYFLKGRLK